MPTVSIQRQGGKLDPQGSCFPYRRNGRLSAAADGRLRLRFFWHLASPGGVFRDLQLRIQAQYPNKPMVQTVTL